MDRQSHRQVFTRVNAPVDEGLAALVSALSEFPTLCTLSSCEGAAFVTFRFGRALDDQAVFLCWLSNQIVGVGNLSAEWGGRASLVFNLSCPPSSVTSLTSRISSILKSIQNDEPCDSPHTGSGSCPASPCRRPQLESYDKLATLHRRMLRDLNT
jgi:hypothetical protein